MGVLQTDTADSLADIEEILHGEVVFLLLQPTELAYLCQPLVHLRSVCGEGHLIHLFLAECAEAALLQEPAYLVETKLMFEVIRINHAAKVRFLHRICKKSP